MLPAKQTPGGCEGGNSDLSWRVEKVTVAGKQNSPEQPYIIVQPATSVAIQATLLNTAPAGSWKIADLELHLENE